MRLHLFEFGDQPWLPRPFRDAMTLYLRAVYGTTQLPALWAAQIAAVLRQTADTSIVDLGSGAAGPIPLVAAELAKMGHPVRVTLTDLQPNSRTGTPAPNITYWPAPVDARAVPAELSGLRTMFAFFHHLSPADAHRILADAAEKRRAICIFEGTSRSAPAIVSSLAIPLIVLLLTPTIRPVSLFQLVFTYLIPVLPVLIFWDGLVSHLRTYTRDELASMYASLETPGYRWEVGSMPVKGLPGGLPYLTGHPVR
jgi:hypothetical protein